MALLLLTMAAVLLAGTASASMQAAMEAKQQSDDLQRRWGSISARRALLDRASGIFSALDADDPSGNFEQRADFTALTKLGDFDFEIHVADEDAKANLNAAMGMENVAKVNQLAESLVYGGSDSSLEVDLTPTYEANNAVPLLDAWHQVFRTTAASESSELPETLRRSTRRITCWGSSRVNIQRASDEVLRETCSMAVTSVVANRLVQERNRLPELSLESLLATVQLRNEQRAGLVNLLSDNSSCYSIWITARSSRRRWTEFHVVKAAGGAGVDTSANAQADGSSSFQSVADFVW